MDKMETSIGKMENSTGDMKSCIEELKTCMRKQSNRSEKLQCIIITAIVSH